MKKIGTLRGRIVDILSRRIYKGIIFIEDGRIVRIEEKEVDENHYIIPGFIDAHIHIESSMLVPYEFAKTALKHGTVATISDPHEIANVLGVAGVEYMLENAKGAGLKFHFGAPSCVPATTFETAGDVIDAYAVHELLEREDIWYLSEMMNYPGVLYGDAEVLKKIDSAKALNKPIDGHAPGLMGDDAIRYIRAGITTDHECFTYEEARHKIENDMKVAIREGSAARNFDALHPLIEEFSDMLMFCSDDKHPDELLMGHIDQLVARAVGLGYDLFDVLKIACINPILHYNMHVGFLRPGDTADMVVVEDLVHFKNKMTIIDGSVYCENGQVDMPDRSHDTPNKFNISPKVPHDFIAPAAHVKQPTIVALDGQLITEKENFTLPLIRDQIQCNVNRDILKIVVVNRYAEAPVSVAFVKNFGLKYGAMASTVAHDSHNIICVGVDDHSIAGAVNMLVKSKGGLSFYSEIHKELLPLSVAGLMSTDPTEIVASQYEKLDKMVKRAGSTLRSPYMTLSFMALLVIPKIKLSDLGLFDAEVFEFY
jgi:adenine deaminase